MSTQIKIHNVGSVTAVRDSWADPCSSGKPFWPKGHSKLMYLGIFCTATVVSAVHILKASVQNDLAVGWSYLFAILTFKKASFKCEGRCKYLLDYFRRTLFHCAFHHNIVDDYYIKSFQKCLGLSTCTQADFKRECKTKHSVLKYCIIVSIIELGFVVCFAI